MRIVSIDCGIVSMSVSIVDVIDTVVIPLCLKTTDISYDADTNTSKGEKISIIELMDATISYIHNVLVPYIDVNTIILIEKQIPSTPSYSIMISLYTSLKTLGYTHINIIDPRLKNKYTIDLTLEEFSIKYLSKYSANKAFAVYNFDKKIKELDCSNTVIDYPKKYKKDIADSFIQLLAWLNEVP
jgi:hypothetical protein